ncbi:MAG: hypothetical protein ACREYB_03850 [Casimicrobiaceae bacterium]
MNRAAVPAGVRATRRALVALLCCIPLVTHADRLTRADIEQACTGAEDAGHCGRLIEALQLKRLPGLAYRDGNDLVVSLFPSGSARFTDSDDPVNGRSYSLWDYIDGINSIVLYVTTGEAAGFTLLQRTTGRQIDFPAEPRLSPDRRHLVVADVCAQRCANEIAVWRVSREGFRKELRWQPGAAWSDAAATWRDDQTLAIDYTAAATGATATVEHKLGDPVWTRVVPP